MSSFVSEINKVVRQLQVQFERAKVKMMESEASKHQAQVKELELSVSIAQEQSEEAKIRNERLQSELSTLKQDYNNHANDLKAHSQNVQANCIELEDRLDAANREIMVGSF